MQPFFVRIRKTWFEIRIFISLSIVVAISSVSFLAFPDYPSTLEIIGKWVGATVNMAIYSGYVLVAILVLVASLLRMWAGSILSSQTVMSFRIQDSKFIVAGPYRMVRNPIYLADLIAFSSLSLCLRPIGLLIPLLIYVHYSQLIKYEEQKLFERSGDAFREYSLSTPKMFPRLKGIARTFRERQDIFINFDGFRHNAQYILFIPGLAVAAYSGKFIHAIIIGLPAVVDWAVIHTIIGTSGKNRPDRSTRSRGFFRSKVFRDILYSQCWEDPQLDRAAFRLKQGDKVFSISSGGCNALAFLADNPSAIVCLDMNRYQNFLLSLKISAFKSLSYNELLQFLGVKDSSDRFALYKKFRSLLPQEEQLYWNANRKDIEKGIIHSGRYERYMHLLKKIFTILIGKRVIHDLYQTQGDMERKRLYEKRWETTGWKILCRIFLSRAFVSLFFDKAFYRYLDSSFSFDKYYRSAVKRAVTELPLMENYFLAYILLGNYRTDHLPPYLKNEDFETIRQRVDRIELVTSGCLDYFRSLPPGTFSAFNFTNIFEWMSPDEFTELLRETVRVAKDGATIAYRNHLVTRKRPDELAGEIVPDELLSASLHEKDLSFIYKSYIVERINKS